MFGQCRCRLTPRGKLTRIVWNFRSDPANIRTISFPASVFSDFFNENVANTTHHKPISTRPPQNVTEILLKGWCRTLAGAPSLFLFPLMEKEPKRSRPKTSDCRTAVLSGEPQGGECLRAEGKRSTAFRVPPWVSSHLVRLLGGRCSVFGLSCPPSQVGCVVLVGCVGRIISMKMLRNQKKRCIFAA